MYLHIGELPIEIHQRQEPMQIFPIYGEWDIPTDTETCGVSAVLGSVMSEASGLRVQYECDPLHSGVFDTIKLTPYRPNGPCVHVIGAVPYMKKEPYVAIYIEHLIEEITTKRNIDIDGNTSKYSWGGSKSLQAAIQRMIQYRPCVTIIVGANATVFVRRKELRILAALNP